MLTHSPDAHQTNLFGTDLLLQLDPHDALLKLAAAIPWQSFDNAFSIHYTKDLGAPSKPIRLMVGLLMLKQLENLSDEEEVLQWKRNPYYPAFCGMREFQKEQPCHSTELVHFRKRIGKDGFETIFRMSVGLHGRHAEEAAGVSFLDFLESDIAKNLAIAPDALAFGNPNASVVYKFVNGAAVPAESHDYSYSWGGAGLSATAPALAMFGARFVMAEIVTGPTLAMMLSPSRFNKGGIISDRDYEVGFGWRLSNDKDGAFYAHHAGVAIGARSALAIYPDEHFSTAVLSNAAWTAAIEQTALTLALGFRLKGKGHLPCPTKADHYKGAFKEEPIAGALSFTIDDGVCRGVIGVDNNFGDWLNEFPQKDARDIEIISLTADGSLSRAALVTPIGAFDLGVSENGGYAAHVGRRRILAFVPGHQP